MTFWTTCMRNSRLNRMNIMISLIRIFIIFIFCFSFSLHADFSDRMKNRLADVIAAKDSGSLGEGVDGFLHLANRMIPTPESWWILKMRTGNLSSNPWPKKQGEVKKQLPGNSPKGLQEKPKKVIGLEKHPVTGCKSRISSLSITRTAGLLLYTFSFIFLQAYRKNHACCRCRT